MHYEDLNFKENKSLCAHYHYLYGRYLTFKSLSLSRGEDKKSLVLQIDARKQLEKSLELRKMLPGTSVGIADTVYSLLQVGNIWKVISKTEYRLHKTNDSSGQAEEYYREAVTLSKKHLGEHELTSTCYKYLGDLFLTNEKYKLAEECYVPDREMRENLGLKGSDRYVRLLNNLGICFTNSNRANKAVKVLESARDMAEKMVESDKVKKSKAKVERSLAIAYDSVKKNSEAVKYARKALELEKAFN